MTGFGRFPPDRSSARYLLIGFGACRADRSHWNGDRWWLAAKPATRQPPPQQDAHENEQQSSPSQDRSDRCDFASCSWHARVVVLDRDIVNEMRNRHRAAEHGYERANDDPPASDPQSHAWLVGKFAKNPSRSYWREFHDRVLPRNMDLRYRAVAAVRSIFDANGWRWWGAERQLSGRRVAIADIAGLQLFPKRMQNWERPRRPKSRRARHKKKDIILVRP